VQVSAFDAVDRSSSTSTRSGVHPSGEVLVPTLSVVSSGTRHPFKNRPSILNQPIISTILREIVSPYLSRSLRKVSSRNVPLFDNSTNVQQFGCRILIDANVRSSWPLNLNTVFVVGSDYNLWLEYAPFGTVPLPECVYPNTQQCRYWIASGAGELSVLDQHSIFVNGAALGSMLSFYNLVGIVP
jgi:hypothetical protein